MKTAKERLMKVREQLGWLTQRDLAAYIGAPIRTVASWCSETQTARTCPEYVLELIERVAAADALALDLGREPVAMKRWAVIDWDGMDTWITACGSKADAIQEADRQWDQLTEKEKESRDAFFVGLINVQLTESKVYGGRFAWAEDPDVCGTGSDVEEIAKDYKATEESEEESEEE